LSGWHGMWVLRRTDYRLHFHAWRRRRRIWLSSAKRSQEHLFPPVVHQPRVRHSEMSRRHSDLCCGNPGIPPCHVGRYVSSAETPAASPISYGPGAFWNGSALGLGPAGLLRCWSEAAARARATPGPVGDMKRWDACRDRSAAPCLSSCCLSASTWSRDSDSERAPCCGGHGHEVFRRDELHLVNSYNGSVLNQSSTTSQDPRTFRTQRHG
jgi:hypothetical protein